MPRISITRSYGAFIFRFLRILHTDFHLFQLFESSLYWFPEWLNQFAVTATVCKSYFSPHSFQHLMSFVWGHSSWSKIKSQICFNMCFLTAKDDEYFWVYFLAIFFSSFVNSLIKSQAHFKLIVSFCLIDWFLLYDSLFLEFFIHIILYH